MKKTIFLLLLTFGIQSAIAKCSQYGIMDFFPRNGEISLNSMFIIEGYANSQKTINSFKDSTIYLESENGELIKLKLQEILKGQKAVTQAIFYPITELKPNTTYYLKFANQIEKVSRDVNQRLGSKKEKLYWKTTDKKFIAPLDSNLTIEFEKTEAGYKMDRSEFAIFDVKNLSEHEVWYKTEVVDLRTNNKQVYYITGNTYKICVGHYSCSGPFTFYGSSKYKVRFTPMNTDGKTLETTDWKIFDNPYIEPIWK